MLPGTPCNKLKSGFPWTAADLVSEVLEALKPQHHAMRKSHTFAESMHAERLGKHPQGLPHVGHVGHIRCLPGLQALAPSLQHLIHEGLHAMLNLDTSGQ